MQLKRVRVIKSGKEIFKVPTCNFVTQHAKQEKITETRKEKVEVLFQRLKHFLLTFNNFSFICVQFVSVTTEKAIWDIRLQSHAPHPSAKPMQCLSSS